MGPPSSHLQHPAAPAGLEETRAAGGGWLSPAAWPARTGSAPAAEAEPVTSSLPRWLPGPPGSCWGGSALQRSSPRSAGRQRTPAALVRQLRPLLHHIIKCRREAPGSAQLQIAQAQPGRDHEQLSLPDRVPRPWGSPWPPHCAPRRHGPAKPQLLLPAPFGFLSLQGCFFPVSFCSQEKT